MQLLGEARIEVLVDVRSNPGSAWASYTNPRDLTRILDAVNIQYIYLGDVLGGRPNDLSYCNPQTGKADYRSIQNRESFQRGLSRLLERVAKYRICIMCAEEDPSCCHRNLLVGDGLRREGVHILHIRGAGKIQTDEELRKQKAGVASNQLPLSL